MTWPPRVHGHDAGGDDPPHRRVERLHPRAVRGDRARHLRLPLGEERLGRHRLQRPRRQVRDDLRGPGGRHGPPRGRRARRRVQPGDLRHRDDGHPDRHPADARRAHLGGAPGRLEARRYLPRPRPADHADVRRRRDLEVRQGADGDRRRTVRPPRRRQHRVPGQRRLRRDGHHPRRDGQADRRGGHRRAVGLGRRIPTSASPTGSSSRPRTAARGSPTSSTARSTSRRPPARTRSAGRSSTRGGRGARSAPRSGCRPGTSTPSPVGARRNSSTGPCAWTGPRTRSVDLARVDLAVSCVCFRVQARKHSTHKRDSAKRGTIRPWTESPRGETTCARPGWRTRSRASSSSSRPGIRRWTRRPSQIARLADPDADVDAALAELDRLAEGITDLDALVVRLYTEEGFAGNREDYYDPRNSSLVDVLIRRRRHPDHARGGRHRGRTPGGAPPRAGRHAGALPGPPA